MSKLLVVFGITGQQGASVANTVLQDAELSKMYSIRGVTRDVTKPEAAAWTTKGVEMVAADTDDRESIKKALAGAHAVFAMTISLYRPGGAEQELAQGKAIADETVAAGAHLLVFSVVPSASKISGGKYPVISFDTKDAIKEYIEKLPIKSAFFSPGGFMQNYVEGGMKPREQPDGSFALTSFVAPTSAWPLIEIAADTGKFVGAVLASPVERAGQTFSAATALYTHEEVAASMSKVSGKKVVYNQVSKEAYGNALPEAMRSVYLNMLSYIDEFGYYGAEEKQLVEWSAKNARGKLTTFEEFLRKAEFKL